MGLAGLYGYIDNKNKDLLTEHHLCQTKLVIDGLGLLHHLYKRLESRYGGEYFEYQETCKEFFSNLLQCGIKPFVVFDGAWDVDDKKYETELQRHQKNLTMAATVTDVTRKKSQTTSMAPIFARHILQSVAHATDGIFNATADYEADQEIVAIANEFNCPVLAFDNDYFVYPVNQGYIPLEKLRWWKVERTQRLEQQDSEFYLQCCIFTNQKELCQRLGIGKDKLALLASLRGNDYLNQDTLARFHSSIRLPKGDKAFIELGKWIGSREDKSEEVIINEVLDVSKPKTETKRKEMLELVRESIDTYELKVQSRSLDFSLGTPTSSDISRDNLTATAVASSSESTTIPTNLSDIKKPGNTILENVRQGHLCPVWLNVVRKSEIFLEEQVEDFNKHSAHDISKAIRASIYGLLLGDSSQTVVEHDRKPGCKETSKNDVAVSQDLGSYGKLPSLTDLDSLPLKEREQILLMTLRQANQIECIHQFESQLQLPLVVTKFWYQTSKCQQCIAQGVIFGFLLNSEDSKTESFKDHVRKCLEEAVEESAEQHGYLDLLHAFAEWQSCLLYANELNVLLNSPLPQFKIANIFSGKEAHELVTHMKDLRKSLTSFPATHTRFESLWKFFE